MTKDPYNEYRDLLAFITSAKALYLGYSVTEGEWLYLKGVMQNVAKTELTLNGLLRCSFRFVGVSPWRRENPVEVTISTENESLNYDKVYDYTYGDESASGAYSYTASGHFPAAIELSVSGAIDSPSITLKRANGETIGSMNVSATIQSGEKLIVSTVPAEAGVWKESTNGTRISLIASINMNDNNFFEWPTGELCTLTLTANGSFTSSAELKIYEYYRSV